MAGLRANLFKSSVLRIAGSTPRPSPSVFVLPGLASRPWYDVHPADGSDSDDQRARFPWVDDLEAAAPRIKREFEAMMGGDPATRPPSDFVVGESEHALHTGDWAWHSYITRGERQPGFAQRCPYTAEVLDSLPDLMCGTPFDFAFFSTLAPGATIAAHTAPCNLRIRCHLALDTPPHDAEGECAMRVAGETRAWTEGACAVFDDAFEHEVWNSTAHPRTVLLLDFWHPDIAQDEREAIVEMFGYAKSEGWLK
jgi:aspartate beta-hydroxylase